MKYNKLAIFGGSGIYYVEEFNKKPLTFIQS